MQSEYVGRRIRIDWGPKSMSISGTCMAMAYDPAPLHPDVSGSGRWVFLLREYESSHRVTTVYVGDNEDAAIRIIAPEVHRFSTRAQVAPE